MGDIDQIQVWKVKRYVRGLRARNAGISLTTPEIALLDKECTWVTEKIGRTFTRTAFVRYVMEEYFGAEWKNALKGYHTNDQPKPKGPGRGRRKKDATTSPNGPESTVVIETTPPEPIELPAISPNDEGSNPVPSTPEPVTSEVM